MDIRVAETTDPLEWSPWLRVGDWGSVPEGHLQQTTCSQGKIDIDYFRASRPMRALQYRVTTFHGAGPSDRPGVQRVAVCFSDTALLKDPGAPLWYRGRPIGSAARPVLLLPVPIRSQRTERPEIAGRICSPTSLSMVLAYDGVDLPVLQVAKQVFDAPHDIYGNWPRNIQGAFSLGVPGFLTRFWTFEQVVTQLMLGNPVVISIQTKPGELRGAPYSQTDGHLLVIVGMDTSGDFIVNDPAASDPAEARRTYFREDLTRVWLRRTAGTAYILQRR